MMEKKKGRIINFASQSAAAPNPGTNSNLAYACAKAGVVALTKHLAKQLGPYGITVNAIAPGFIAGTGSNAQLPDETVKGIAAQLPVGRPGHVDDVARAALYLASPEAGFITGEILNVNGGRLFGR